MDSVSRPWRRWSLRLLAVLMMSMGAGWAAPLSEYQIKAGYLLNFISFTEWPAQMGSSLKVCVFGTSPFEDGLAGLNGKTVGGRALAVEHRHNVSGLVECQIVFISQAMSGSTTRVVDYLRGTPVLLVSDSPGAAGEGVALGMNTEQGRVTFEANLGAARANGLGLSSKLLRLATKVYQ